MKNSQKFFTGNYILIFYELYLIIGLFYRIPVGKSQSKDDIEPLVIGPHNVFEVGCHVEATKIGANNVFESNCFVGNKVTVTNGCIIGAGCQLKEEQELKENLIVFGKDCQTREGLSRPPVCYLYF